MDTPIALRENDKQGLSAVKRAIYLFVYKIFAKNYYYVQSNIWWQHAKYQIKLKFIKKKTTQPYTTENNRRNNKHLMHFVLALVKRFLCEIITRKMK